MGKTADKNFAFFKKKLAVTTALTVALLGYARRAYADCTPQGGGTYLCSGYSSNPSVYYSGGIVTTDNTFSSPNSFFGLTLGGAGGTISFTDTYGSIIHGIIRGLSLDGGVNINANSVISSYQYGVYIRNFLNNYDSNINLTGDINAAGTGIFIYNQLNINPAVTTNITTGNITAGTYGIYQRSISYGNIAITTNGDISANARGIFLNQNGISGEHDVSITVNGNITSNGDTIALTGSNNVLGSTTVFTKSGTLMQSSSGGGINLGKIYYGTVNITANGDIQSTNEAIFIEDHSTAVLTITAGGAITSDLYGVKASSYGDMTFTLNDGGSVRSNTTTAIALSDTASSNLMDVTIDGDVYGATNGVTLLSNGTDLDLSVGSTAHITGYGGTGLTVLHNGGANALSATIDGTVTGSTMGAYLSNISNSGDMTVSTGAAAVITGQGGYGLKINAAVHGYSLIMTGSGSVTGASIGLWVADAADTQDMTVAIGSATGQGGLGIYAYHNGTGDLTVTSTGTVYGTGIGLFAHNTNNAAGGVTVNAHDVTSANNTAIDAVNSGSGALAVTSDGAVQGTRGIYAHNAASGTNLTVSVNDVTGNAGDGVTAFNEGTGALAITATGDVQATGMGIYAHNAASAAGISITAYNVASSGSFGIYTINSGGGALSVTATGLISGVGGVYANNTASGTGLTVTVNDVTSSNNDAIFAKNSGSGNLITTVTGIVQATGGHGIYAQNAATGGNLVISGGGNVSSSTADGVYAINLSAGALTIDLGDVSGVDYGVYARNAAGATGALSVTVHDATGTANDAIDAKNAGTGALSITASGTVSGARGIYAYNATTGTSLTISGGGNVTGTADDGIYAKNKGTGALSVTMDDISGARGIYAYNAASAAGMTLNLGDLSSTTTDALYAKNLGTGAMSVTTGDVYGKMRGVVAYVGTNVTGVTVNTGGIIAQGGDGLSATSLGSGAMSVTTGDVTANNKGITATNAATGTSLTINAGDIAAGGMGINARNLGSGALTINAGDISGGEGVHAYNAATATGMTINVGDVSSTLSSAVYAKDLGSGAMSITTADIPGTITGIKAYAGANVTGMTIQTGNISSQTNAIDAGHFGSGAMSVTTGDITAVSNNGIVARADVATTGLTITAGDITAGQSGIAVTNFGSGALSVTAGNLSAGNGYGIYAYDSASGTDMTIEAGNISSANYHGMFIKKNGSGPLSVTNDAAIAAKLDGIRVVSTQGDIDLYLGSNNTINSTTGSGVYLRAYYSDDITAHIHGDITSSMAALKIRNFTAGAAHITIESDSYLHTTGNFGIDLQAENATLYMNGIVRSDTVSGIRAIGNNQYISTGVASKIYADVRGLDLGGSYTTLNHQGYVKSAYDGIRVSGASHITLSASSATIGGNYGLYIKTGADDSDILVDGYVYGYDAVHLLNGAGYINFTSGNGSAIKGKRYGIYASAEKYGIVNIDVAGDIDATTGIYAYNNSVTGNGNNAIIITQQSTSTIAGTTGIKAKIIGEYDIDIYANGTIITPNNQYSINAISDGDISVVTGSTANVGNIKAITYHGDLTLDLSGISRVTNAFADTGAHDLRIHLDDAAGTVAGGIIGVQKGTGILDVNIEGHVGGSLYLTNYSAVGADVTIGSGGIGQNLTMRNYAGHADIAVNGDVSGVRLTNHNDASADMTIGDVYISNVAGIYSNSSGDTNLVIYGDLVSQISSAALNIRTLNSTGKLDLALKAGSSLYSRFYPGLNISSKDATIEIAGDVTSDGNSIWGAYWYNNGTSTLHIANTGYISTNPAAMLIQQGSAGDLTLTNDGVIKADSLGLWLSQQPAAHATIVNNATGKIYGGIYLRGGSTDITINGGRIVGDVNSSGGTSTVTVAGDFTSEGNFNVSSFTVSAPGDFTFGAGKTVTSSAAAQVYGAMRVVAGASSVIGDLTVENGGLLDVGDDFAVTGEFINNGTTSIITNRTLTVGTMSAGTGDLIFGVTSELNHAQLTVTGGAANLTGQTISIDVAGVNNITDNDETLLVHGAAPIVGGPGGTRAAVTDNSFLWDFQIVDGTGLSTPGSANDLYLVIAQSAATADCTGSIGYNNTNACNTLLPLDGVTTDPRLLDVMAEFNGAPTQAAFNDVLEAVQPTIDGSSVYSTLTFADSIVNLTGERLRQLRETDSGDYGHFTGLAAGDAVTGSKRGWFQASWQYLQQKRRDGIDGYESQSYGGTFGGDTDRIFDNGIAGIAVSYGKTIAESQNANTTRTDVDSYQVTVYADLDLGQQFYFNGIAGYAFNRNETTRHNVGMVPGLTAQGDFDSSLFIARAEAGKAWRRGNVTLTPNVSLNASHYVAEDYTETGAGGAGLNVSTNALDQLDLGAGGKAAFSWSSIDGSEGIIDIHGGYRHELVGGRLAMQSGFIDGGTIFDTKGPLPDRSKVTIGAGLKYYDSKKYEITANYDLDLRAGFMSQTGMLRFGYRFE